MGGTFNEISTHSLTRRLTCREEPCPPFVGYFNSQPHEEADGKGYAYEVICIHISTHSLTRRLTTSAAGTASGDTFQLTASRGG